MDLLSILLLLSPVASLSDGVLFDVEQRPLNGALYFGEGVDKGRFRHAPFGDLLVMKTGGFSHHPDLHFITVGSPNLVAHCVAWDHWANEHLNRGQL